MKGMWYGVLWYVLSKHWLVSFVTEVALGSGDWASCVHIKWQVFKKPLFYFYDEYNFFPNVFVLLLIKRKLFVSFSTVSIKYCSRRMSCTVPFSHSLSYIPWKRTLCSWWYGNPDLKNTDLVNVWNERGLRDYQNSWMSRGKLLKCHSIGLKRETEWLHLVEMFCQHNKLMLLFG